MDRLRRPAARSGLLLLLLLPSGFEERLGICGGLDFLEILRLPFLFFLDAESSSSSPRAEECLREECGLVFARHSSPTPRDPPPPPPPLLPPRRSGDEGAAYGDDNAEDDDGGDSDCLGGDSGGRGCCGRSSSAVVSAKLTRLLTLRGGERGEDGDRGERSAIGRCLYRWV